MLPPLHPVLMYCLPSLLKRHILVHCHLLYQYLSVLVASQKTTTVKGTASEPCEHCKKASHRSENCFVHYPNKLADYHARRAARGDGTSSTHICS